MPLRDPDDVSDFLLPEGATDHGALDSLLSAVYGELRALAEHQLRNERPDHTLQPTALVHEAYFRLRTVQHVDALSRAQFFGLAAQMMRRILVNHAHSRNAEKRGGGMKPVTLDESVAWTGERDLDLAELDVALSKLATFDLRQARVVELRFFAGLGIDETAEVLGISPATVKREWTVAKAWLHNALADDKSASN